MKEQEKCEGCTRAKGSYTIYTCNCGVDKAEKEAERIIWLYIKWSRAEDDLKPIQSAIKCAIIHVSGIIEVLSLDKVDSTKEIWKHYQRVLTILENK